MRISDSRQKNISRQRLLLAHRRRYHFKRVLPSAAPTVATERHPEEETSGQIALIPTSVVALRKAAARSARRRIKNGLHALHSMAMLHRLAVLKNSESSPIDQAGNEMSNSTEPGFAGPMPESGTFPPMYDYYSKVIARTKDQITPMGYGSQ